MMVFTEKNAGILISNKFADAEAKELQLDDKQILR